VIPAELRKLLGRECKIYTVKNAKIVFGYGNCIKRTFFIKAGNKVWSEMKWDQYAPDNAKVTCFTLNDKEIISFLMCIEDLENNT